jgi:thiol-disulfide isomerase/thioredoxin
MKRVKVFSASWCGPCKLLKGEVLPSLEKEGWSVEIIDIDTDEGQELSVKFGVRGIPTCFVYDGDELIDTIVGAALKSKFTNLFE